MSFFGTLTHSLAQKLMAYRNNSFERDFFKEGEGFNLLYVNTNSFMFYQSKTTICTSVYIIYNYTTYYFFPQQIT